MTKQLTFRQYLDSKDQLRKAIENTPVSIIEYEVRKYCSVSVGETKEEAETISLRPRQKLIVKWRYDNILNPTPDYIKVLGIDEDMISEGEDEEQQVFWTGYKLQKWLLRHTQEGKKHVHKI